MKSKPYEELDEVEQELYRSGYRLVPQKEELYCLFYKGKPFTLSPLSWEDRRELEEKLGRPIWKCNGTTRKIYFTEGRAKVGIRELPKCLKDKVEIVEFVKKLK